MRRLFGLSKEEAPKEPPPSLDESIKTIDGRVNLLEEKIKTLEKEIVKQRDIMNKSRNMSARNSAKQRALQLMKQKKMYEGQRAQMMQQSFNMEQANFMTQTMQDTMVQVRAMKGANEAMKANFKEINLDDIEDLQDDMEDVMMDMNEVQEIMSRSYAMPYDVDEADLEQELNDLELDFDEEEMPSYLTDTDLNDIQLPSVPEAKPAQAQTASGGL